MDKMKSTAKKLETNISNQKRIADKESRFSLRKENYFKRKLLKNEGNLGLSVFSIFLLCCLTITVIRYLTGSTETIFSFKNLLDNLLFFPSIDLSPLFDSWLITGDWGVVDFLRQFLNANITIFQGFITLLGLISNALLFIVHAVRVLFGLV